MMQQIYITHAEDVGNLTVRVHFNDDTTQTVDVDNFIRRHPHPQYNKYLQPRHFRHFALEYGNLVWGLNWDLMFPVEQLYQGRIEE